MKIKFIELLNFRQLKNARIDFSTDEDKNVTIVMGNNGTGKTTLAQAFSWCLYGETSFKIKSILNKEIENNLSNNDGVFVKVTIGLEHNGKSYEIERQQTFYKKGVGKTTSEVALSFKNNEGNTIKIKEWEREIRKILPKELSKYFFFDGERIEKMSKEVQGGKKSNEFAEAVRGLLGLNVIIAALEHLNPSSRRSVVGLYEASYNESSNQKVKELGAHLIRCKDDLRNLDTRIEELKEQEDTNAKLIEEIKEKLRQFEESRKLQHQRDEKEIKILELTKKKKQKSISLLKDIANFSYPFCSQPLIKEVIDDLSELKFEEKTIPELNSKVIKYLLEHHKCICGREILEGSEEYKTLENLLNYLPPKSLGTIINEFNEKSKTKLNQKTNLFENIMEKTQDIVDFDTDVEDLSNELRSLDEKLLGKNVTQTINDLTRDRKNCEISLNNAKENKETLIQKKGQYIQEIRKAETSIEKLSLANKENRKIEYYKAYTIKAYEYLKEKLDTKENSLRILLEQEINNIFKTIYEGGLSLDIDKNYGIKVHASNYETETSTAQSISVIFAFISGIIKLAREFQTNDNKELASEPYPLVMDAPLSAFDKHRIEKVCEVLPDIAEQVIIFIKDTDGDLAKENLKNKIGKIYSLEKINEFYSVIK